VNSAGIGDTGVTVTNIGFGTSPLGSVPDTYGYGVDEERAKATLRAIFDSPVNLIDTSRNYGMGRSESRIGAVIRERGGLPEGLVIATKLDRDMSTGRFDGARARRSFEESLDDLSLDRVGVLHLHDPEHAFSLDEVTRRGGALDVLFRIKSEGLADAVGLAMGQIDIMFPLVLEYPFDVILNHNRFTLLNRRADEMFDVAHEAGMAVWNAAPYAGGVLAKGSGVMPRLTYEEASEATLAPVREVEKVCAAFGIPTGAAALQFSMRDSRIDSTIVGVSRPERVAETLSWAELEIPEAAWSALSELQYATSDPEADRR
jgi:D-threo-aldose 1-dehydrogenase